MTNPQTLFGMSCDLSVLIQQTVAMLMQPEGVAVDRGSHEQEMVREEEERDIDGLPLLESQPIDFSRTGGGVTLPVVGTEEGADLDGEPMEVCQACVNVNVFGSEESVLIPGGTDTYLGQQKVSSKQKIRNLHPLPASSSFISSLSNGACSKGTFCSSSLLLQQKATPP